MAIWPPAQVMKAEPDGHTLLLGSIGMLTVNPVVVSNLTYDTRSAISRRSRSIAKFPLILTVNAKAPVKTVQELVAYAKANPDKANAAATGPIFQVVQKMFEQRTGTTFAYIAFRANSEAMMALMRGDALMSLSDVGPATGPLQDGRVRALAVTSPSGCRRIPTFRPWRKPASRTWRSSSGPGCWRPPRRRQRSSRSCRTRSWRS